VGYVSDKYLWSEKSRGLFKRRIAALKDDSSEYVRKSVGNSLRDISKKFPELIKEELDCWDINSKEIKQVYKLTSKFIK
jgi:phosphomethylpyrimidine kinase